MTADKATVRRDLGFYAPSFAAAIVLGHVHSKPAHIAGAIVLVGVYVLYVRRTLRAGGEAESEEELDALTFDATKHDPPATWLIALQAVVALALIMGGAELFVEEITTVTEIIGVSALVLSLIIAPLATELPEKINSVIWMRAPREGLGEHGRGRRLGPAVRGADRLRDRGLTEEGPSHMAAALAPQA